ncbi:hypothetical protein DD829_22505 [Chryseobacterium sp. HMWF035]|nr:hypothetical protein DD829_22505 [Chryseobacterium sp. HMWF035]
MNTNGLKQIMILGKEQHADYLQIYKEEPLNFEEFVNFMLGSLYDNGLVIEEVIPARDGNTLIVVYRVLLK